jgi:hypothetical protein
MTSKKKDSIFSMMVGSNEFSAALYYKGGSFGEPNFYQGIEASRHQGIKSSSHRGIKSSKFREM